MLDIYKKILDNGIVHLKTDSEFFFGYTIGIVSQLVKSFMPITIFIVIQMHQRGDYTNFL